MGAPDRHDAPDENALSVLRAFTVVYEPEIIGRARNIVEARRVIAGDYTSSASAAELTDSAIGSCAAALVDVLVARALLAGPFRAGYGGHES